jgi:hypothetical protein
VLRAMQSPYRSPSGTQPHFLIKGMTVPSELAQSAGGLASIFSRAMCVRSSSLSVTAHDPLTFVVVAFLLMAVAIVACCILPRRAIRMDPVVSLRYG